MNKIFPNLLIIGERRCGTTSLSKLLNKHEQISISNIMDKAFFVDDEVVGQKKYFHGKCKYKWEKNLDDYLELFQNVEQNKYIGEKSADYFFWEKSHKRIKDFLGTDVKLIVILRNPVQRAWSMYWNEVGKNRESLPFEKAIFEENLRIKNSDYAKMHLSYLQRGLYDISIKKLLKTFKKNQIFFVIQEELIKNPEIELKKIFKFLSLDYNLNLKFVNENQNSTFLRKPFWNSIIILKIFESIVNKLINFIILFIKSKRYKMKLKRFLISPFRFSKSELQINKETKIYLDEYFKDSIKNCEILLSKKLDLWK